MTDVPNGVGSLKQKPQSQTDSQQAARNGTDFFLYAIPFHGQCQKRHGNDRYIVQIKDRPFQIQKKQPRVYHITGQKEPGQDSFLGRFFPKHMSAGKKQQKAEYAQRRHQRHAAHGYQPILRNAHADRFQKSGQDA